MTFPSKVDLPVKVRPPGETSTAQGGPGPPFGPEDEGGGGDWTLLTTAENSFSAHLIEGRLTSEGIACVLDHFNPSPGAWLKPFGDPLAPVKIYVKRGQLATASMLLHETGHHPPDPSSEGPPVVRTLWWVTFLIIIVLTLATVVDMFFGDLVPR